MQLMIDIPEETFKYYVTLANKGEQIGNLERIILDGIPLPKGHGRIVDIGKIDEDMVEQYNPIIYLTINGEYIEAVSLDYLNDLPTIIEAESESEE